MHGGGTLHLDLNCSCTTRWVTLPKEGFIKRKKAWSAKGLDKSSKSEDPILPCNSSHTYAHNIEAIRYECGWMDGVKRNDYTIKNKSTSPQYFIWYWDCLSSGDVIKAPQSISVYIDSLYKNEGENINRFVSFFFLWSYPKTHSAGAFCLRY